VVGVAADVHVCRSLAETTGGSHGVCLSEQHLHDLMMAHSAPPPAPAGQLGAELVRMGFPQRSSEDPAAAMFVGKECVLASGSYICPRLVGVWVWYGSRCVRVWECVAVVDNTSRFRASQGVCVSRANSTD